MDSSARDQGLRNVSVATRWVVAGGIALSGVLSAVVARAAPGHKSSSTSTQQPTVSNSSGSNASSSDDNSSAASSSGGLQPPTQAPSAGLGGGSVRSGAS